MNVCKYIEPVLTRLRLRLSGLFWSDPRPIEVFIALIQFGWALQLIQGEDVFARSPVYELLSMIAPENVWAMCLIVLATIQVCGLFAGSKRLRKFGVGMSSILWTFIATLFWLGNGTTAHPTYGAIALVAIWAWTRHLLTRPI